MLTPNRSGQNTYAMMPPSATKTPRTDLSPIALPDVAHPKATMVHVLTWPTTVLDTGPVCAMMKNCEMLIRDANSPDCNAMLVVQFPSSRVGVGGSSPQHQYHDPTVEGDGAPGGEGIDEGDGV